LLFHGNNGYANAPQCYVYTYTAFLIPCTKIKNVGQKPETRGPQNWIKTETPGGKGITVGYVTPRPTTHFGLQKANAHDCLCSYKIFVRIGDVDVSWDSFLRPLSTGLWVVMAASAVAMALALKICFQVDLGNRKKQRMDTALQDLVFATFGAVFCSQGNANCMPV
jgi:hypothetical protein